MQCSLLSKKLNFYNNQEKNENNINQLLLTTLIPTKKLVINQTEKPNLIKKNMTISLKKSIMIVNCVLQDSIIAECSWKKLNNNEDSYDVSLVGYRIILEIQNNKSNNIENVNQFLNNDLNNKRQQKFISVVGAEECHVLLQNLLPETSYRFRVQPLTVHGLSTDLYETFFNTKSIKQSKIELKNDIKFYNINKNNDDLTHSIIENSLDSLSLSTSFSTHFIFNFKFICILIILTLINN